MLKKDLHPPHSGPAANPLLYGIAVGLAQLFPPVDRPGYGNGEDDGSRDRGDEHREADGE